MDGTRYANLPEGGLADGLRVLVDRVAERFDGGEGTVVLAASAVERLGLRSPDDVAAALAGSGWVVRRVTAWATLFRPAAPRQRVAAATVHLCVLPWLLTVPDMAERWPWGLEYANRTDSRLADLAWQLGEYHRLVGVPFRARAGVAGLAAAREMAVPPRSGKPPLWISANGPHRSVACRPLVWSRDETPEEAGLGWRHKFDASAAYLAAAGLAYLARDPLRNTGPRVFDRQLCGYWSVALAPLREAESGWPLAPPLVSATGVGDGDGDTVWLTTPTVALAEDLGIGLDIRDSWTAAGKRLLRTWSERLNAARQFSEAEEALHKSIKWTYRETVGMLNSPKGRVYRPDWHLTITALSRANLLRRVHQFAGAGGPDDPQRWPLEVDTDCLTYAAGTAVWRDAAPVGMKLGTALGEFHPKPIREAGQ